MGVAETEERSAAKAGGTMPDSFMVVSSENKAVLDMISGD